MSVNFVLQCPDPSFLHHCPVSSWHRKVEVSVNSKQTCSLLMLQEQSTWVHCFSRTLHTNWDPCEGSYLASLGSCQSCWVAGQSSNSSLTQKRQVGKQESLVVKTAGMEHFQPTRALPRISRGLVHGISSKRLRLLASSALTRVISMSCDSSTEASDTAMGGSRPKRRGSRGQYFKCTRINFREIMLLVAG